MEEADPVKFINDLMARCDSIHDFCQGSRNKSQPFNLDQCMAVNGSVESAMDEIEDISFTTLDSDYNSLKIKKSLIDLKSITQNISANDLTHIGNNIEDDKDNTPAKQSRIVKINDHIKFIYLNTESSIQVLHLTIKNVQKYTRTNSFDVKFCLLPNYSKRQQPESIILDPENYGIIKINGWIKDNDKDNDWLGSKGHNWLLGSDGHDVLLKIIKSNTVSNTIEYISESNLCVLHDITEPVLDIKYIENTMNVSEIVCTFKKDTVEHRISSKDYLKPCLYGWKLIRENWQYIKAAEYLELFNQIGGGYLSVYEGKTQISNFTNFNSLTRYRYGVPDKNDTSWHITYFNTFTREKTNGGQLGFDNLKQGDLILYIRINQLRFCTGYIVKWISVNHDVLDKTRYHIVRVLFNDGEDEEIKLYSDYFGVFREAGWTYYNQDCIKNLQNKNKAKLETLLTKKGQDYNGHFKHFAHRSGFGLVEYGLCKLDDGAILSANKYKYSFTYNDENFFKTHNKVICEMLDFISYYVKGNVSFIDGDTESKIVRSMFVDDYKNYQISLTSIPLKKESTLLLTLKGYEQLLSSLSPKEEIPLNIRKRYLAKYNYKDSKLYTHDGNERRFHDFMYEKRRLDNGWVVQSGRFESTKGGSPTGSNKYNSNVIKFMHDITSQIPSMKKISSDPSIYDVNSNGDCEVQDDANLTPSALILVQNPKTKSFSDDTKKCLQELIAQHFLHDKIRFVVDIGDDVITGLFPNVCHAVKFWDSAKSECETNEQSSLVIPDASSIFYKWNTPITISHDNTQVAESERTKFIYGENKHCYPINDALDYSVKKRAANGNLSESPYMLKTVHLVQLGIISKSRPFFPGPLPRNDTNRNINYALDIKRSGDACLILYTLKENAVFVTKDQLAFLSAQIKGARCILISSSEDGIFQLRMYNPNIVVSKSEMTDIQPVYNPQLEHTIVVSESEMTDIQPVLYEPDPYEPDPYEPDPVQTESIMPKPNPHDPRLNPRPIPYIPEGVPPWLAHTYPVDLPKSSPASSQSTDKEQTPELVVREKTPESDPMEVDDNIMNDQLEKLLTESKTRQVATNFILYHNMKNVLSAISKYKKSMIAPMREEKSNLKRPRKGGFAALQSKKGKKPDDKHLQKSVQKSVQDYDVDIYNMLYSQDIYDAFSKDEELGILTTANNLLAEVDGLKWIVLFNEQLTRSPLDLTKYTIVKCLTDSQYARLIIILNLLPNRQQEDPRQQYSIPNSQQENKDDPDYIDIESLSNDELIMYTFVKPLKTLPIIYKRFDNIDSFMKFANACRLYDSKDAVIVQQALKPKPPPKSGGRDKKNYMRAILFLHNIRRRKK